MSQRQKNLLKKTSGGLVLFWSLALLLPKKALAQTYAWKGVCVGQTPNSESVATIQGFECLIANVFVVFVSLVGLAGFVMFVFGAFKWLISGGNSKDTQSAQSTMTHSIIGLVVTLSAFIIINLIAEFTGVNAIKSFQIPTSGIFWPKVGK